MARRNGKAATHCCHPGERSLLAMEVRCGRCSLIAGLGPDARKAPVRLSPGLDTEGQTLLQPIVPLQSASPNEHSFRPPFSLCATLNRLLVKLWEE